MQAGSVHCTVLSAQAYWRWRVLEVICCTTHEAKLVQTICTVVLVIFATGVKKRKAEIKIRAFLASLWADYRHWEAIVLFIQTSKLPTNWINCFLPSERACCKDH